MTQRDDPGPPPAGVLEVACGSRADARALAAQVDRWFAGHPFAAELRWRVAEGSEAEQPAGVVRLVLQAVPDALARWAPAHDTLGLTGRWARAAGAAEVGADALALRREILAAWLLGPSPVRHGSPAELHSALRTRIHTVRAARRTLLAFDTRAIARPEDCWRYDEDHGFVVRPGVSLIEALRRATQPAGELYAFSCYRATEYVLLLGLACELAHSQPALYQALERLWQRRAVASGEFHDVFLVELGSPAEPVPMRWYVPGDRVWFRNPDEASADVSGYEGSWVIYLGGGLFSNFWQRDAPFDFDGKCIEVYHWRHAVRRDAVGEPTIDEAVVTERVRQTRADRAATRQVLERMQRYRDARGIYAEGGCIDSTREHLRSAVGGRHGLVLPD